MYGFEKKMYKKGSMKYTLFCRKCVVKMSKNEIKFDEKQTQESEDHLANN
jgi:hypothetical protein